MRICAASDIHYPRFGREWSSALARSMCESGADLIILAGDISAGPDERYQEILSMFASFEGPKLFVPGNHDLWSEDELPSTEERYRGHLRHTVEQVGFHYLPGAPFVVDGVAVVGTVGWWDFSFRQMRAPVPGLRVTPMRAVADERTIKLRAIPDRSDLPWEQLTAEDYASKALVWRAPDGDFETIVWSDAVHTDWQRPDPQVARLMADELRSDIWRVADRVDTIVGVTHCVPFEALLEPFSDSTQAAYARAFVGARVLGEVLADEPRVSLVICGHQHEPKALEVGRIAAANCSVAQVGAGPLLIDIPRRDLL